MKKLILLVLVLLLAACGTLSGDVLTFETADPNVAVSFKLLPAPVLLPTVTPTPEPECLIKVNQASDGEWIYHLPGQSAYERTIIDTAKGEFFACTEQEAIDAGARKALR